MYSTVEEDTQERRIEKYKDKEETGSKFTLARHIRIENMSTQRTLAINSHTDKYEQTVEDHYKILVQPARGQASYNLLLPLKIQKGHLATYCTCSLK